MIRARAPAAPHPYRVVLPRLSPPPEEAVPSGGGEHADVSLSLRRLRSLRRIEQDLAASDPGLDDLFRGFTERAGEHDMPRVEHLAPWPFPMLTRLWRGRSVTERVKDWVAENWNEP